MIPGTANRNLHRGFTLLELIVVIGIGILLIALMTTSVSSTMQGVGITTSADLIRDILSEAQAAAVAQNQHVEVRIYDLAPGSGGTPYYRALQLYALNSDGTTRPLDKIQFLPDGVAIDATAAHSTLIASNPETTTPDASDPHLDTNTRVFHFLPSGGLDLNPSSNWFLTVRAATQSDPAHFPANWACIRVEPVNGHAQIYRP